MTVSVALWRRSLLAALMLPLIAVAQRVNENPVTAAEDAFGTTVGSQTIGLYDAQDVRGFSPSHAGNLRIEGLYFDQQTYDGNNCLMSGQTSGWDWPRSPLIFRRPPESPITRCVCRVRKT